MPAQTLEQVKKIEAAAAKQAAEAKGGDAKAVRGVKKKLRRAQRKRRRLATGLERAAVATAKGEKKASGEATAAE